MMRSIIVGVIVVGASLTGCTRQDNASHAQIVDTTSTKITKDMNNLISIVEIPTTDFGRAVTFYQTILGVTIEEVNMDGVQMGVLASDGEGVNVVLVKGDDYKPSIDGTIVYLNAGDDLQFVLKKVEANGGIVIVPKTEISPEMGFFAMFTDPEGNRLGLHSKE